MSDVEKTSKVEKIKEESRYLRGNILNELADENPYVSDDSYELLKFHGSYQGYDRDTATPRKKAGLEKEWEFMLRMKCPGGRLSPEQYLNLEIIADTYANKTLRITTRQTFQFHCILKKNLKNHINALNKLMLSTLGGCGDVVRNVMCSAAPFKDVKHNQLLLDTNKIADFCAPKTTAYEELWLNEETDKIEQKESQDFEPLYGKYYMPRKFKIGLALPEDNSIDVLTHDLGFVLIYEGETLLGYNVYIGGGLGITHNKPETYARVATAIAFILPQDLIKMTEAVVKLQRDNGDRADRKHARLKYVVVENGEEWTKKTLTEYFGKELLPAKENIKFDVIDHMGWHLQKDGKWFLGIVVDSGRIADNAETKIKSALHKIISEYKPNISLTADQNIILYDIKEEDKNKIEQILIEHKIKLRENITNAHRYFLACVAMPTCGKALAEAERVANPLILDFDNLLAKHNLEKERISIRITGCPNGCARPYVGDIGIVGRTPGFYALYIGGDFAGTRLNEKFLDKVPYENMLEVFDLLFGKYAKERNKDELFGDYSYRVGINNLVGLISDNLSAKYKWAILG